jgi:DNA-binding transcriptional MerR regulator
MIARAEIERQRDNLVPLARLEEYFKLLDREPPAGCAGAGKMLATLDKTLRQNDEREKAGAKIADWERYVDAKAIFADQATREQIKDLEAQIASLDKSVIRKYENLFQMRDRADINRILRNLANDPAVPVLCNGLPLREDEIRLIAVYHGFKAKLGPLVQRIEGAGVTMRSLEATHPEFVGL